jgi:rfaE bifunctional protein kinase chain/domain
LVVHKPSERKEYLGGASIVAMHASNAIKQVDYLSLTEKNDKYLNFINSKLKSKKINKHFIKDDTYKTVIKTRYKLDNNTIFRTNEFLNFNINKSLENKILKKFIYLVKNKNLLIFSDFNYGFLPKKIVTKMIKIAKKLNSKIIISGDSQTSSQNGDISKFKGVNLITPTEIEARRCVPDPSIGLAAVSKEILRKLKFKNLIITLNKNGIFIDSRKRSNVSADKINSLANNVIDTAGAGDAFLTYASLGLAAGANIWESSYLGSIASAVHVSTVGNEEINFKIIENCINKME